MLALRWLVLSLSFLFAFSLPAFAESTHENPGGPPPRAVGHSVEKNASQSSLRFFVRLTNLLEIVTEMKANGTPFADSVLESTLRQLAVRIQNAPDANSLLSGTKMGAADQTVWFNNLETLLDYTVAIMSLQAADNLVSAAQIQATAAENIEKTWRIFGKSTRRNWAIPDASDSRLSKFGVHEAQRRELLVTPGNQSALNQFIAELALGLRAQSGSTDPVNRTTVPPPSVAELTHNLKTNTQEAQKLIQDYERLRGSFQKYLDNNVRGKTSNQISQEVLKEARRRSAELRDLEQTIQRAGGDLPQDLREAIERYRSDPRAFVEREAELFLQRLKTRDPRRAEELERLVSEYRLRLRNTEAEINKHRGKTAAQLGSEGIESLRRESAAFRRAELDLRSGFDELANAVERYRREIEGKGKDLSNRLNGQVTDFRNTDLRRIEGELRSRIESTRRQVEQDLNRLRKSLDR